VMAVAPADADPDVAFARLAGVASRLRDHHPDAVAVSAGMSGDLEAAVRHGATHLRVGSALLGSRPPLG
jgi:PLP dependent protein